MLMQPRTTLSSALSLHLLLTVSRRNTLLVLLTRLLLTSRLVRRNSNLWLVGLPTSRTITRVLLPPFSSTKECVWKTRVLAPLGRNRTVRLTVPLVLPRSFPEVQHLVTLTSLLVLKQVGARSLITFLHPVNVLPNLGLLKQEDTLQPTSPPPPTDPVLGTPQRHGVAEY